MLFSPEMDAMQARMKAIILRDSEGFFDDPKESEDLQITIRIACEFFVFLRQSKDVPELDEAEYMAGTIRSGLDWFFSMAHTRSEEHTSELQSRLHLVCRLLLDKKNYCVMNGVSSYR